MSTRLQRARSGGKGYEKISRDLLQQKTLSLKARGLISLLLSLSDDWDCNGVEGIVRQFCDLDGVSAVNAGIKELEAAGMFARMKRQGTAGKWEWLWTYDDDPREVAAAVQEWEAKGYRTSSSFGGNRDAKPPKREGETPGQAVLAKPEHGDVAMLGKPVHGQPVNGEPQNKESLLLPSGEETPTGQIHNTQTRERATAAEPPRVVDNPVVVEFPDEIQAPADPDEAIADWSKRPKAQSKFSKLSGTAASVPARSLVTEFSSTLTYPLKGEIYAKWSAAVSKLMTEGVYPEEVLRQAMVECMAGGKPPAALYSFAAAVANRAPDRGRSLQEPELGTTGLKLQSAEARLREEMRAADAREAAGQLQNSTPRAISR